jgi:hypothetical protein
MKGFWEDKHSKWIATESTLNIGEKLICTSGKIPYNSKWI